MENSLPESWEDVQLIELLEKLESGSRPKGGVRGILNGIPSVGGEHVNDNGGFDFSNIKYIPKAFAEGMNKGKIEINDILVVKDGATTGKTSFVDSNFPYKTAFVNEHVFICRPSEELDSKYVYWFLRSKDGNGRVMENFKGSAQGGINQTFASNTLVPVAPLLEQQRIAAKLDVLMEKIDRSRARLERIPKILKRFRQSILSAAVSETGDPTFTEEICEIIQIGPFGTQLHRHDYISHGIPLINPTHIQAGQVIPDAEFTISKKKFLELSNYHLKKGDVIMGRRGEMARCALIGAKEDGWLCGTGSLFFRPNNKLVTPQYLYWLLSNSNTKEFLESESKGTTMSNLNLSIAKRVPICLPSIGEQKRIVNRVEQLFSLADKIEARYTKAKAQLDKLPQSLLAKAFRGELVPQDSTDEPASVLLERIKKEKAAPAGKMKKLKRYEIEEEKLSLAAED